VISQQATGPTGRLASVAMADSGGLAPANALTGVRVLLKSLDLDVVEGIGETLKGAGAHVETAASPQEAFDAFQADPPDVLVSDLDGPEAPDYGFIRRVRSLREGSAVPAVALSGLPWEEHRPGALAAGFSQWISKPAAHAVIAVIAALLGRKAPAAPGPVLTDLATMPIAETIQRLWRERRTGDLFVRTRRTTKMVSFNSGRIVFAASNVKKERLGEVLMALGTISSEDFARASTLVTKSKVRFGDALVAAGVMTEHDVAPSVTRWIERIVVSLFDLKVGSASFEDRPCMIPPGYRVELPVDRVLYDGIRTMSQEALILAALGPLDRRVEAATPAFAVEPADLELLGLAKAPVTLRRLAWGAEGISLDRLRAIYALVSTGVLVEPGAKKRRAQAPAVVPVAAPAPKPVIASARSSAVEAAIRNEIGEQLARSESLDLETWLGVSPSAPKDDIVRALEQRQRAYEGMRSALGRDAQLNTDLELLMGRISMSLRLAQRPAAAPPPPPAPPPAVAPSPATNASMEVEHLLLEASIRMSVGDFANAARTYRRLVQLQPEVAEHHLRLGMVMARSPRTARQAEAEFQEAARLDPRSAEIRYQLGLYYKGMNVRSRSIAELRIALELNPRHKKARAELEGAAPQDSALGNFKKLLGG
jgi:DNA-binding response OmpR family regulator/tetratricopeptide (TPR) repeat protein